MNARELIEKWEREYEQLGFPDAGAAETYLTCARELRAALPEQPQEPVAFQFGDNFEYVANFWPPENVGDTPIRPLYADLDHYQDEGREILNDQPADCLFE